MAFVGYGFERCLCVCFPHDISKTDAAGIAKLYIEMFHDVFWKSIYFGDSEGGQKSRSQGTETLPAWVFALCECWLLLGFSF